MVKLVILLRAGVERETETYNDFLMLLETLPGLRRKAVSDVYGAMGGPAPYTTIIEAYFDTQQAMQAALLSETGVAAGQALLRFAGPDAITLYVHTQEEDYGQD